MLSPRKLKSFNQLAASAGASLVMGLSAHAAPTTTVPEGMTASQWLDQSMREVAKLPSNPSKFTPAQGEVCTTAAFALNARSAELVREHNTALIESIKTRTPEKQKTLGDKQTAMRVNADVGNKLRAKCNGMTH